MVPASDWQTLFSVQAECSATLTGLVFVAVSINLAKIVSTRGLTGRAAESLAQFLQVFFVCSAALIPGQTAVALAAEIVAIGLLSWVVQFVAQFRYARSKSGHPKSWLITRIVQTTLGSAPLFIASAYLPGASPAGLYWLTGGFFFSFLSGIFNAWVLLIEINR